MSREYSTVMALSPLGRRRGRVFVAAMTFRDFRLAS
jgi:hypothetical protein